MFDDAAMHMQSPFSLEITPLHEIHSGSVRCGKWQVDVFMHVWRLKKRLKIKEHQ